MKLKFVVTEDQAITLIGAMEVLKPAMLQESDRIKLGNLARELAGQAYAQGWRPLNDPKHGLR